MKSSASKVRWIPLIVAFLMILGVITPLMEVTVNAAPLTYPIPYLQDTAMNNVSNNAYIHGSKVDSFAGIGGLRIVSLKFSDGKEMVKRGSSWTYRPIEDAADVFMSRKLIDNTFQEVDLEFSAPSTHTDGSSATIELGLSTRWAPSLILETLDRDGNPIGLIGYNDVNNTHKVHNFVLAEHLEGGTGLSTSKLVSGDLAYLVIRVDGLKSGERVKMRFLSQNTDYSDKSPMPKMAANRKVELLSPIDMEMLKNEKVAKLKYFASNLPTGENNLLLVINREEIVDLGVIKNGVNEMNNEIHMNSSTEIEEAYFVVQDGNGWLTGPISNHELEKEPVTSIEYDGEKVVYIDKELNLFDHVKYTPSNSYSPITVEVEDEEILKVNGNSVKGLQMGETEVTITTDSGKVIKEVFEVKPIPVPSTKLIITNKIDELAVGEVHEYKHTLVPFNSTDEVTYTSADESVVSVEDNKVTAVSEGYAIVVAETDSGLEEVLEFNVVAGEEVESIENIKINNKISTMDIGDRHKIRYTITPSSLQDSKVTLTSQDVNIIDVEGKEIVAKDSGNTIIEIKTENGKKDSFSITVNPIDENKELKEDIEKLEEDLTGKLDKESNDIDEDRLSDLKDEKDRLEGLVNGLDESDGDKTILEDKIKDIENIITDIENKIVEQGQQEEKDKVEQDLNDLNSKFDEKLKDDKISQEEYDNLKEELENILDDLAKLPEEDRESLKDLENKLKDKLDQLEDKIITKEDIEIPITSITALKNRFNLEVGDEEEILYTITPTLPVNDEVSITTDSPFVVEIQGNTIKALKEGNATVTLKSKSGVEEKVYVTVEKKEIITPVSITAKETDTEPAKYKIIDVKVDGEVEYIELPNGNKFYSNEIEYLAMDNGSYSFTAVGKDGKSKDSAIVQVTNIDKTAPIILFEIDQNNLGDMIIKSWDEGSGLDYVLTPDNKKLDGPNVDERLQNAPRGTYMARDKAGNVTTKDFVMDIVNLGEDTEHTYIGIEGIPTSWTNQDVKLTFGAINKKSGIEDIEISVGKELPKDEEDLDEEDLDEEDLDEDLNEDLDEKDLDEDLDEDLNEDLDEEDLNEDLNEDLDEEVNEEEINEEEDNEDEEINEEEINEEVNEEENAEESEDETDSEEEDIEEETDNKDETDSEEEEEEDNKDETDSEEEEEEDNKDETDSEEEEEEEEDNKDKLPEISAEDMLSIINPFDTMFARIYGDSLMAGTNFGGISKERVIKEVTLKDNNDVNYKIKNKYGEYIDDVLVDKIDKNPATIDITVDGSTVSYDVQDDLSGIKTIFLPNGENIEVPTDEVLSINGNFEMKADGKFKVIALDYAGNLTEEEFNITIEDSEEGEDGEDGGETPEKPEKPGEGEGGEEEKPGEKPEKPGEGEGGEEEKPTDPEKPGEGGEGTERPGEETEKPGEKPEKPGEETERPGEKPENPEEPEDGEEGEDGEDGEDGEKPGEGEKPENPEDEEDEDDKDDDNGNSENNSGNGGSSSGGGGSSSSDRYGKITVYYEDRDGREIRREDVYDRLSMYTEKIVYARDFRDYEVRGKDRVTLKVNPRNYHVEYTFVYDDLRRNDRDDRDRYSDRDKGTGTSYITNTDKSGYISGYPDGTFRPNKDISREEVANILNNVLEHETRLDGVSYTDISGRWSEHAIMNMSRNGALEGYPNGEFRPTNPMTRAEMASLVQRITKNQDATIEGLSNLTDIDGRWFTDAVNYCYNAGYIKGVNATEFRPQDNISRADFVIVMNRVLGIANRSNTNTAIPFTDINPDNYYFNEIMTAVGQ